MRKLSSPFELIKIAVNLFVKKENLLFLVQIYLPVAFFSILSIIQNYLPESVKNSTSVWLTVATGVLQITYLLVSVFVTASGIIALGKIVGGGEFSVRQTFKNAWKRYWKFLLISALYSFAVGFGFVLLIIPGVLFVTWYAFSRFIFIEDERSGVLTAFGRSKNLVKGRFWKIFGRLIVFGIFGVAIDVILTIIPFGLGSVISGLCGGLFMLPAYLLYKELSA